MKIFYRDLAAAFAASCLLLGSCGGDSEKDLLASAKTYLDKSDETSAIIQLKSALQKNPQSGEARFLLGQAMLKTGDAGGAVVELERAHDLELGDDKVLPLLAEALVAIGQAKKVTDRYAGVTLANPKAAAALKVVVARAFVAQGNIAGSAEAVKAALQADPKNLTARLLHARLVAGRGAFDEALALAGGIIADNPKRAEALQLRGELLWVGKSDFDGAIKAFRETLTADPRHLPAHTALITLLLQQRDVPGFKAQVVALKKAWPNYLGSRFFEVQAALIDQDLKGAREGAQKLLQMAPQNALVLQLAGAVELQNGALLVAEDHLNKAIRLSPDLQSARRLLGETYLRSGLPIKALAALQPLLEQAKPGADVLALAAEAHLQSGDTAKAETYFTLAAKADPDDPKLRTAVALTLLAKGNAEGGFAQLESLASTDKSTYADLALIAARVQRNDLDAALKAIDRLQAKLTSKPLPHLLRGRILLQRKDLTGARASFEKALALDAAYFPAMAELAGIDLAEQKPEQALKRFEALAAREPKDYRVLLAVADLRQRTGAKPAEVAALLADAVKSNPVEPAPRLALVEHYLAQRNPKAALASARDAVAALPDNLLLLDALGRAQMVAGDAEQAITSFSKIAAAHPAMPEPLLRLAEANVIRKDYKAATQNLRRALEITPNLLAAQRGLVRIALINKRVDDAIQVARTVQKQRPAESAGYLMEGEIHLSQRAWDPAISAFRAALERDRSSGLAMRLHALYQLAGRAAESDRFADTWLRAHPDDADFVFHLGSTALDHKDYASAEARYRQVLALRPANALALNNVASLMVQQGKPGALPLAERANQLQPNKAPIMDTLASALAADKQFKKAIEWQQKVVALAPDAPVYRLNLAKLLIASGERSGARDELEKLAALGGKFQGQAEVASLLKGL